MVHEEQDTVLKVSKILSMPLDEALVAWNKEFKEVIGSYESIIKRFPHVVLLNSREVLSIQCGEHMYCTPRNNEGPYSEVEVATWKKFPAIFNEYSAAESTEESPMRVYAYVPTYLLKWYIASKGGIDLKASLANYIKRNLT